MANRLRHGQARVQFLANKVAVFSLLKKGHSIKEVHEILIKDKIITMSYTTLISFLKKQEKNVVYHINKLFKKAGEKCCGRIPRLNKFRAK